MNLDDALDILARLDAARIEWWVDGGWGVDALLGEETRPHDDLDLAVRREAVERLPSLFPEFRRAAEEWWPARFVLRDSAGRQIDFHPLTFDVRGDGWQELLDGTHGCYPAPDLGGRGRIGARNVRCITPELQLQHHDYPTPDDVDWSDVWVLCERFNLMAPSAYKTRPGFIDQRRVRAAPRLTHARPGRNERRLDSC